MIQKVVSLFKSLVNFSQREMRPAENNGSREFTTTSMLEHIQHFSSLLASTTDLQELYHHCLLQTKEIFHIDYSTLLLLEESGKKLVIRDTIGFPREMIDTFMLSEGQGLPSLALQSRKVEIVEDFRTEDRFEVTDIMVQLDMRSAIAAPMMIKNKVFGVLIGHTLEQRFFSGEEGQVYQVLANHAAIAIENAIHITSLYRSESKIRKQVRELQKEKDRTREITNEFESIFSTIVTGVILLKGGRYIARCNEKFAEMFGYSSVDKLIGMNTRKLHLSEEKYSEFGRKFYGNLVAGEIVQTEYPLKTKDGVKILCRLSGRAVDQSHPPDLTQGFVWVIEDITRTKEMEQEILQARKLESIGVLAGGIGHDFNNILSAILGNLGLAERMLESDHQVQDLLNSAIEAAARAKDLTSKLLLFTRRDSHSIGTVELHEFFTEYNFERMLQENVELSLKFQSGVFPIKIMPDHLKAILQNLLLNADGCMPDGGQIQVEAYNVAVLEDDIPGLNAGKYVEISVADNGSGIEGDILENIFDPYFTTKNRDSSRGIGLGLAIVHSIVKRNHGSISVKSSNRDGTVFTVLLPAQVKDILTFQE